MVFKRYAYLALLLLVATVSNASILINEMMVKNVSFKVNENFNFEGWVELYNSGASAVDLSNYYFSGSSDDLYAWQIESSIVLQPGEFTIFYFDEIGTGAHANFKLDSKGGTLYLSDETGMLVDQVDYPAPYRNASYGRTQDGGASFAFFMTPTQGASNDGSTQFTVQTNAPQFSIPGGVYSSVQGLTLTSDNSSAKIYYTLDGTEPTTSSSLYSSPLQFCATAIVRAIAVVDGEYPSDVATTTYFVNEKAVSKSLPMISLVSDNDLLYGDELGAFAIGTNGATVPSYCSPANGETSANYMNDWDRPCNFELFDESATPRINQEVNVGAFGACSRTKQVKSIKVKANKVYGTNKLDYPIFKEKPSLKWKSVVLRNGGNDFGRMLFRDGFLQTLAASGMDLDHQAYQPAVVFVNGEYYGMLGIRERTNKDFIYSNYGLDEEEFCIEEKMDESRDADDQDFVSQLQCADYQSVIDLSHTDMSSSDAFSKIDELIDVNEFLNYFMTEIYLCNNDWSGGNIKAWHRNADAKWRWILYDTEYSTSLYGDYLQTNGFTYAAKCGIFPRFKKNAEIKRRLMTKFVAHAGTTFAPDHVSAVMDSMYNMVETDAQYYFDYLLGKKWNEASDWKTEVEKVRNFMSARRDFVFDHAKDSLGLGTPLSLRFYSDQPGTAYLLNELELINRADFCSKYFTNSSISVKAIAPNGYKFDHWNICKENFAIPSGATWKYLYKSGTIDAAWKNSDFDDSSWSSGEAPLGVGSTAIQKTSVSGSSSSGGGFNFGGNGFNFGGSSSANTTTYFRNSFTISDINEAGSLLCEMRVNDGAVVYLNGTEVYRYNLPNGTINDTTYALKSVDTYASLSFELPKSLLQSGTNVLAVEVHDIKGSTSSGFSMFGGSSSTIVFDMSLFDPATGFTVMSTSSEPTYTTSYTEAMAFVPVFVEDTKSTSETKLYINEICDATKQFVDDYSEAEDWIEIYNDGSEPVDLGGMYLSDKRTNLTRFLIPTTDPSKTTIPAKGYLIFWADADSSQQGVLHTNFQLPKDKEETVILSKNVNGQIVIVDSICYRAHLNGATYARFSYEGDGAWALTSWPTFAKKNIYAPADDYYSDVTTDEMLIEVAEVGLKVYPNPVVDYLWFSFPWSDKTDVTVYDYMGHLMITKSVAQGESIYVGNLPTGMYAIAVATPEGNKVVKVIKR